MLRNQLAIFALVLVAGCGEAPADEAGMIQSNDSAAAEVETAFAGLSAELKQAAAQEGDLLCNLPMMPGGREAPAMDPQTQSYYSGENPGVVAAFYRHAGEARGQTPKIDAMPGNFEIDMTPDDQSGCQIMVGEIQDGTTLVQITPHDWDNSDEPKP